MNHDQRRRARRGVLWLSLVAVGMFGFGFALVPLYNMLCQVTGLNGKTGGPVPVAVNAVDPTRTITVQFLATNNADLPWDFYPVQKSVRLHPGQEVRVAYYARNKTNARMTVQAIPSVTPGLAAQHLKKTECFCFTRQTFNAHEGRLMPVLFHVDNTLPQDMTTITLSYTMFDVTSGVTPAKAGVQGKIGNS